MYMYVKIKNETNNTFNKISLYIYIILGQLHDFEKLYIFYCFYKLLFCE